MAWAAEQLLHGQRQFLRLRPQPTDPLAVADPAVLAHCQLACSKWSVKAPDFPPAGAYGFSFLMPASFVPGNQGQAHRPVPVPMRRAAPAVIPRCLARMARFFRDLAPSDDRPSYRRFALARAIRVKE
jgi:hypothetical protein